MRWAGLLATALVALGGCNAPDASTGTEGCSVVGQGAGGDGSSPGSVSICGVKFVLNEGEDSIDVATSGTRTLRWEEMRLSTSEAGLFASNHEPVGRHDAAVPAEGLELKRVFSGDVVVGQRIFLCDASPRGVAIPVTLSQDGASGSTEFRDLVLCEA